MGRWRAALGSQLGPSELCPAQLPAWPCLRRLCASPWRSRGSGKRRRPGGLRLPLRLRPGSRPLAGTVRSRAGNKAGGDGQDVLAVRRCGKHLGSWQFPAPLGQEARGGFCREISGGGSLTAACWGAASASAETPKWRWTRFCPECCGDGLCASPRPTRARGQGWHRPWRGRTLLVAEGGFCLRRFGRCSAEDDDNSAGVWPGRAA